MEKPKHTPPFIETQIGQKTTKSTLSQEEAAMATYQKNTASMRRNRTLKDLAAQNDSIEAQLATLIIQSEHFDSLFIPEDSTTEEIMLAYQMFYEEPRPNEGYGSHLNYYSKAPQPALANDNRPFTQQRQDWRAKQKQSQEEVRQQPTISLKEQVEREFAASNARIQAWASTQESAKPQAGGVFAAIGHQLLSLLS